MSSRKPAQSYLPSGYQLRVATRKDSWRILRYLLFPTKVDWIFVLRCYSIPIVLTAILVLANLTKPAVLLFIIIAPIFGMVYITFLFLIGLHLAIFVSKRLGVKHYIFETRKKIVGQIAVQKRKQSSHIFSLWVLPQHQHLDLATYGLQIVIQDLPRPIHTSYEIYNPASESLRLTYEKLGFVREDRFKSPILQKNQLCQGMVLL